MNVVTVTPNPALDTYTEVDQVEMGRKLRCEMPRQYPGGGGVNVSRAIRVLGGQSHAVWTCGGAFGELLGRLLNHEEIENTAVGIEASTRQNLMVEDLERKGLYRFGLPGPPLSTQEAEAVVEAVARVSGEDSLIVASGSLPPGEGKHIYPRLARAVRETGCKLVLDCRPEDMRRTIEAAPVYLLKLNDREFMQLSGIDDGSEEAIQEAAVELVEAGHSDIVVVTLGAEGSLIVTVSEVLRISPPKVEVDSPVGAGDSMAAGLVLGIARGRPLLDAATLGVAAAASAVTTSGTELCEKGSTERIYRQIEQHQMARTRPHAGRVISR